MKKIFGLLAIVMALALVLIGCPTGGDADVGKALSQVRGTWSGNNNTAGPGSDSNATGSVSILISGFRYSGTTSTRASATATSWTTSAVTGTVSSSDGVNFSFTGGLEDYTATLSGTTLTLSGTGQPLHNVAISK
jgi:hypothetical protein